MISSCVSQCLLSIQRRTSTSDSSIMIPKPNDTRYLGLCSVLHTRGPVPPWESKEATLTEHLLCASHFTYLIFKSSEQLFGDGYYSVQDREAKTVKVST